MMKSVIIDSWNAGDLRFHSTLGSYKDKSALQRLAKKVWSNASSTSVFRANFLLVISITQYTSCVHFIALHLN